MSGRKKTLTETHSHLDVNDEGQILSLEQSFAEKETENISHWVIERGYYWSGVWGAKRKLKGQEEKHLTSQFYLQTKLSSHLFSEMRR